MSEMWTKQKEALEFAIDRMATMLAMDMGTGKTRVSIELLKRWEAKCVLVVCPRSVVHVWPQELKKYAKNEFLVLAETGNTKSRVEAINNFVNVPGKKLIVINYDVIWRPEMIECLKRIPWEVVILDESHKAKSAGSKTSKACFLLGKRSLRRLCLSGTPMANSPLDVYGQYRFLDSTIFGTNHARFLDKYAVFGGPERKFVVGVKNRDELGAKFNSIAYQCKKSDMLDQLGIGPEPVPQFLTAEMGPAAKKVYKDLQKDFVSILNSEERVIASSVQIRVTRLQQITSGFMATVDWDKNHKETPIDDAKEKLLVEYLDDLGPDEDVVIFCRFKYDMDRAGQIANESRRQAFELSGRIDQLQEWKDAAPGAVLVVQYQSGSAGIDLTKSCYAVYYSATQSLYEYEQSISRMYRPGQTRPVTLTHLVINRSIDVQMYKSLVEKHDIIEDVMSRGIDTLDITSQIID